MKSGAMRMTGLLLTGMMIVASFRPALANEPKYPQLSNAQSAAILDQIEKDIKENYYDPTMHGMEIEKIFADARKKIATAPSQDDALLIIAGAASALRDSHTRFIPPARPYSVDYGFMMQAIGDTACYVTAVRAGSDAEAKGLHRGDRVLSINGVPLERQDIATVGYGYRVFPQSGFHLEVSSSGGPPRSITVMSTVTPAQRSISTADVLNWMRAHPMATDREQYLRQGSQSQFSAVCKKVLFWKLPSFNFYPAELESQSDKAKPFDTVVLDLRGNAGGRVDTLQTFLGEFFDHDVKIGDRQERKTAKPLVAKARKNIRGKLIVLIDSDSSSAAEIFARVIQLEKRGTVLGDRSSGQVMESRPYIHAVSIDSRNVTQYGVSVTVANLLMADGNSLERIGVTPDERLVPSPDDLLAGRDPVLAWAASLAGTELSPESAGKLFPFHWPASPPEIE
jgi:C-terminal processing protease CtpA/Prc